MTLSDPKFISLTTIQVGKRIKDIKESFWIRELQTLHKQKGLNLLKDKKKGGHTTQWPKRKRTNNDLQNTHIKLKI
jgi:hypothetical protein